MQQSIFASQTCISPLLIFVAFLTEGRAGSKTPKITRQVQLWHEPAIHRDISMLISDRKQALRRRKPYKNPVGALLAAAPGAR